MSGAPISAPERWSLAELLAAGWREEELAWEAAGAAALAGLAAADRDAAEREIGRALRLAREAFAADDPRLGASLANRSAATDDRGRRMAAEARAIWRDCGPWIARLQPPRLARSSLYHLRMEQRHRPAFEARWRTKWAEIAVEARARLGGTEAPLVLLPPAEAAEALARWRRERPPLLIDTRRLLGGALLLACRGAP